MMRRCVLAVCLLLNITTLLRAAENESDAKGFIAWQQYRNVLAKDSALVRYYTFDQANSESIRNLAGDGKGAMNVAQNDLYFNERLGPIITRNEYASWTTGRWPVKSALCIGSAKASLTHSFFYNTATNAFTVEAWIRTHADATSAKQSAVLFSVGSGFYEGWRIYTDAHSTTFVLGRPAPGNNPGPGKGFVALSAKGPLTGHVWHHLVAMYEGDAKTISLFIDGTLAVRQEFDGIYTQPNAPASNDQTPELDRGGLMIGSNNSFKSTLRFDIDELAIYNKALSPETIAQHFNATRPTLSDDEQIAQHRALLAAQAALEQISISIPTGSGYFPCDQSLPLHVAIGAAAKLTGSCRISAQLCNQSESEIWHAQERLSATDQSDASMEIKIPPQLCGLYRLDVQVVDSAGKTVKNASFPIAMRKPLMPISQMPATAPLAHFGAINMHYEDLGLGGNFERMIQPWCPLNAKGEYDWSFTDLYVKTALDNGLVVMFTLSSPIGPRGFTTFRDMANDLKAWETWVRLVVNRYKDRVQYWEVLNEPNGGGQLTPEEYVRLLKSAHAVIRELAPTAKIIGICGTANFAEWTEDVLKAGAGPYLDILSFHDYIGTSPIASWSKYHKVDRVRAAVDKYIGHPVPLWNGECGIHQPVRIQGRPMTDEQLLKAYPGRSNLKTGWAIAGVDAIMMTTEHRCACWQVQSILMDLAGGTEKYFLLMGSNRYYPYHTSSTEGLPSEKGIALAAMASVTTTMRKIRFIPLTASDASGMMVTDKNGKNTAIFFADKRMIMPFAAVNGREYQGMDFLGNPLTWRAQQQRLSLQLSDEPIYLFDVPADFAEAHLVNVTKFPANVSPHAAAPGEITVTNPSGEIFSGTLNITAEGCRVSHPEAVTLAAGETKTFAFTVQAGGLSRGKHILAALLMQNGTVASRTEFTFNSEGIARAVLSAKKTIVLDGNTDDWENIIAEKANQPSQVVIGRPDVGVDDKRWWQGPKDLSYTVKTTWRPDDGIYLLIEVTDNMLNVAPQDKSNTGYLWDCIELFIDSRPVLNQTTAYSPGAEQLLVIPRITETATPCTVVNFARPSPTVDVEFVGKRTATGYLLQGRIKPRSSEFKLAPGTHFGLDISVDDADDAQRRVQMSLHGSAKNSFDTSQWGRYELKDEK